MSLIKFLSSKTFLKQLGLAVVAIVVLSFILLKWLNISTNHGDFHTVPNLTGKSISVAPNTFEKLVCRSNGPGKPKEARSFHTDEQK